MAQPVVPLVAGQSCSCGCDCKDTCDCGTDCATGQVTLSSTPLSTPLLSFSYSYCNLMTNGTGGSAANPNFGMGTNIIPSNFAYATTDGMNIAVIWGAKRAAWFPSGGGAALYGSRLRLTTGGGHYVVTDPDTGNYYTFDSTSGLLQSITPPGNLVSSEITANDIADGLIRDTYRSVQYDDACGNTLTTKQSLLYSYFPATDTLPPLLQYVTLTRTDTTTVQIRRLAMTYFGSGDAGGNKGDLQTVSLQQLEGTQWQTISTEYYRWYTQNYDGTPYTQPGFVHGLKYVVGPEAFARLSQQTNPFTAPDQTVAGFADYYYEYTDHTATEPRRVTTSITDGGTLPCQFTYQTSGFTDDYNNWSLMCTVTHADGSQEIIYGNYISQVILTDLWDTPGFQANGRWITYTQYDSSTAIVVAIYTPPAINMGGYVPPYNDSSPYLNVQVNTTEGLITTRVYVPVTAGSYSYPNYLAYELVQQGSAGTPSYVQGLTYNGYSLDPAALVLPVTESNYPDGTLVNAVTTNYAYTFWMSGAITTVQVKTKSVQPPIIYGAGGSHPDQNGDNIQYQIDTDVDAQGRPTQQFDPYNSASPPTYKPSTRISYDEPTGAVIQIIRNPYTGTPPDTVQYDLTTDFVVDWLGRRIKTLGVAFLSPLPPSQSQGEGANSSGAGALVLVRSVTFNVYRDVQYEVWAASGYATGSTPSEYVYTLQNPVSITRMDHEGRPTDSIQAVRLPTNYFARGQNGAGATALSGLPPRPAPDQFTESAGELSPGDAFPQISFVRWAQNIYNDAHDLVTVRRYTNIPATGPGLLGENYDETAYGYDIMNRRNTVRAFGGTITRQVFDVRNNALQTWVGTNDTGATDEAPDGFGAPGNNMQNTVTNHIDNDNSVGGNNLLTSTARHIDGTAANDYRSDFFHDYRNRRTGTREWIVNTISLHQYLFTSRTLDNNGNETEVQQFDSTLDTLTTTALVRQSKTSYDYLQRVYQTLRYGVTPGSMSPPTDVLTGNIWYNALNRVVKHAPEGAAARYTKSAYDLANRLIGTYTGYAPTGDTNNFAVNSSDLIFEQTELTLDAASNTMLATSSQSNPGNTTKNKLTSGNARVSCMAFWQDGGGRPIATANYGAAASAPSVPLAVPISTPTVMVYQTAYNNRGEAYLSSAPSGRAAAGLAAFFNGSSHVTVPNKPAFCDLPLSISLWIRSTDSGGGDDFLSTQADDSATDYGWRLESPDQPYLVFNRNAIAQVSTPINDGAWHHIAFTISSGGTVNSYLDGAAQTTGSAAGLLDPGHTLDIGAAMFYPRFYRGSMTELLLLSKELTSTEVAAIYNGGFGVNGIDGVTGLTTADVIAGYQLAGDFVDWTGHGNDGTNNGATFVGQSLGVSADGAVAVVTLTRTDTDDAGRTVRTIQNYQPSPLPLGEGQGEGGQSRGRVLSGGRSLFPLPPGEGQREGFLFGASGWGPAAWSSAPATTGPDVNVTVLTSYTPDDNVATLTAVNPATGNQTTTYLYGTTLATSTIARNDLLAAVLYPDAADSTDAVQYQFNRQSEVTQMRDQNGNVHQYFRDLMGRQISDQVRVVAPGVDFQVLRIDTAYEIRGMVSSSTSYGDLLATYMLNQVLLGYGEFEQLTLETQDNSGTGGPIGYIAYGYNTGGSSNSIAPLSVTYPDGATVLNYNYTATDDIALDRPTSLKVNTESTDAVAYTYFGVAGFASVTYGTSAAVSMTLATSTPSYPGFDLFDRVVNVSWIKGGSTLIAGLGYGYNLANSRTYRADLVAESLTTPLPFDELYTYDEVERLQAFTRGKLLGLAAGVSAPSLTQSWNLDATGNWAAFSNFDAATPANSFAQERASNRANEITLIGATASIPWATPGYDRNGNMTTIPMPTATASGATMPGVFDAWNRLMSLSNGAIEYFYDGLNRRNYSNDGTTQRWFIVSKDWQVLDEYTDVLGDYERRYVWGLRYVDDLVLRDRTVSTAFDGRLYALQDGNWNVVAIYDPSASSGAGAVVERFAYTAYGLVLPLNPDFTAPYTGTNYGWTVLYTGRALDDESGLYYYRMRFYQPLLGVFVSRDPITANINPYQYCSSIPTSAIDPSGQLTRTVESWNPGTNGNFQLRWHFALDHTYQSIVVIIQKVTYTEGIGSCKEIKEHGTNTGKWNDRFPSRLRKYEYYEIIGFVAPNQLVIQANNQRGVESTLKSIYESLNPPNGTPGGGVLRLPPPGTANERYDDEWSHPSTSTQTCGRIEYVAEVHAFELDAAFFGRLWPWRKIAPKSVVLPKIGSGNLMGASVEAGIPGGVWKDSAVESEASPTKEIFTWHCAPPQTVSADPTPTVPAHGP